jgi:2-polyprenyl-3-methyl-5-hydroxy-6-metoxy-1,4-benzoquinol methylase
MESGICTDYSADYSGRTWRWYEPYLLRFSNKPTRILDLGCGLGLFLECCREHGIEAVGMELSGPAIHVLEEKKLDFIQHDLGTPFQCFEDESFDAVLSFQVIEHLREAAQRNMLKESYRVLRPGGQLQVDSPCRYYREAQLQATHIGLLAPKELRAMAESAGFRHIDMSYNYRQTLSDLPDKLVEALWEIFHPDIFAQTAAIMAQK